MWNLDEYRKRPQRLADHLPWAALIGPGVVLSYNRKSWIAGI